HGEMLGGNGKWGHGGVGHYRDLIRVPLIVKRPGQTEGNRSDRLTTTLDIRATVMEYAGIETDTRSVRLSEPRKKPVYVYGHLIYTMIKENFRYSICRNTVVEWCEQELLFRLTGNRTVKFSNRSLRRRMSNTLSLHLERSRKERLGIGKESFRERLSELGYIS
ncbi:MAG: sulfatase-like hydrolase/transferase, partial [Candidatus Nanohaloarchaea archaeon]